MIGLSPLSAGHRRRFQPTCVRPSTGSYPRFSLPTDSSPGFASAARDSSRPVKARFRSGSLSVNLAPRQRLAGSFYKRHAVTTKKLLRLLVGARFQVLFHSPPGVLFTFPLTVLVRYRSQGSTQAWMVVHPGSDRVSRAPALLRDRVAPSGLGSRTGLSPAAAGPPMPFRSPAGPAPGGGSPRMRGPATPSAEPLPGMPARRFGHRSPFARRYSGSLEIDFLSSGYLDVSVPRVVLPTPMCSGWGYAHCCAWVRPFGDPRVEGCVLLAGDYRSLPRPSSAPCAKASAVRPWYLAGPHRARGISTCR